MRYICSICGYVYDETGNVPWNDLPEDWKCPLCGAAKSDFVPEGTASPETIPTQITPKETTSTETNPEVLAELSMKPLNAIETSVLCSNLAKGCEKQYQDKQAAAFRELAAWFGAQAETAADSSFVQLLEKVNADLETGYPGANAAAGENGDRGALRSLVWSEKVTRILKSLLTRYSLEGDAMLENTGVYVCTICGFVYVGNDLPQVCPICKVPNRKFEEIGGETHE